MSEQPTPETEPTAASEFEAITSQEDFDKRVSARIARERAKYADYTELKAKATEFEKLQEANKSEIQKAQERAAQLEKELESERFNFTREKVASEKGVPAKWLHGSTVEELQQSADEFLAEITTVTKAAAPKAVGKSGVTGTNDRTDPKERVAQMIAQAYRSGG